MVTITDADGRELTVSNNVAARLLFSEHWDDCKAEYDGQQNVTGVTIRRGGEERVWHALAVDLAEELVEVERDALG